MDNFEDNEIKGLFFYRSYYEALAALPPETVKECMMAICAYVMDGEEPEGLSALAQMFFTMAKPSLGTTAPKSKGGAPKGNLNAQRKNNLNSTQNNHDSTENNPKQPKTTSIQPKTTQNNHDSTENNPKQPYHRLVLEQEYIQDQDQVLDHAPDQGLNAPSVSEFKNAAREEHTPSADKPTLADVEGYIRRNGLDVDARAFCEHYNSVGWQIRGQPIEDWRARVNVWHIKNAEQKANPPPKESAYMAAIKNRVSDIDGWLERRSADYDTG